MKPDTLFFRQKRDLLLNFSVPLIITCEPSLSSYRLVKYQLGVGFGVQLGRLI